MDHFADDVAGTGVARTQQDLTRWRDGDDLAAPLMWLARWRSDRRTIDQVAAEFGVAVDVVRRGIERALLAVGDHRSIEKLERKSVSAPKARRRNRS